MKEVVKKKWLPFCCAICIIFVASSCSSTQRISVKQNQGEQVQETTIESDLKVKELSLVFNSTYLK